MMTKLIHALLLFTCMLATCIPSPAPAQQVPLTNAYLDGSKVSARLWNGTEAFWDLDQYRSGYEVPKGSGLESCFASAFWIGGIDSAGQLHLAGQTYRYNGVDFYSGPVRDGVPYPMPTQVAMEYGTVSNHAAKLPDGRFVFQIEGGFDVFDPATALSTPVVIGLESPNVANPVYHGGKVFGHFRNVTGTEDYLVEWDTTAFSYTVACTLQHMHAQPSLVPMSTGEILIAGNGYELYSPLTGTTTLLPYGITQDKSRAIYFAGDSALIVGGGTASTTWYHNDTKTLSPGPTLGSSRISPGLSRMPGGGWIVAGGPSITTTDIIDKYGAVVTPGPPLAAPMLGCTGALTPGGTVVLVAGETVQTLSPGAPAFEIRSLYLSETAPIVSHLTQMDGPHFLIHHREMGYIYFNFDLMKPEKGMYQHVWKLSQADIDSFLSDFSTASLDFDKYPDVNTWPAKGRFWEGEDHLLAPFRDVNGNGKYNPAYDGDYPCITGEQMLWHVYHDDGEHTQTGGQPLKVQVEQSSYVFDQSKTTCTDTFLDYATFYHLEITHKGDIPFHDVYLGYFMDADLGNFFNNFIGTDTTRQLSFCFLGSLTDPGGYGDYPPAIGFQMLNSPRGEKLDYVVLPYNDLSDQGVPIEASDYYNMMRGRRHDGTPVENGCGGTAGPRFAYPGDAGWCGGPLSGCSEVSAGNTPFDRILCNSVGPISLAPGDEVALDFAILWAQGDSADNLSAVCRLQEASDNIVSWWRAQHFECFDIIIADDDPSGSTEAIELFPNPNGGSFTLRWSTALPGDELLSIRDAAGREVARKSVPRGTQEVQLAEHLAAGLYHVVCSNGTAVKMVVQ